MGLNSVKIKDSHAAIIVEFLAVHSAEEHLKQRFEDLLDRREYFDSRDC